MAYYSEYEKYVNRASDKYNVPAGLIYAVIEQESGGDPAAVSSAGAVGLMQLMPATAKEYGVTDRTNPEQSILGGTELLSNLLERYNGDTESALAAYYAGAGNVDYYGKEKYKSYYSGVLKRMNGSSAISTPTVNPVISTGGNSLAWWGNIIVVLLCVVCVVLGIIFGYLAIAGTPDPVKIVTDKVMGK